MSIETIELINYAIVGMIMGYLFGCNLKLKRDLKDHIVESRQELNRMQERQHIVNEESVDCMNTVVQTQKKLLEYIKSK